MAKQNALLILFEMYLIIHGLSLIILFVTSKYLPPNTYMNSTEQVTYHGYPLEIHQVTTKDGYILQLHRIPHGLNNTQSTNKTVTLLVPGLFCTSGIFFIYGPEKSLAYILADVNYDVWVLNTRGTTHSRKHVVLDPDQEKAAFYNFSFHEVGEYDLPASMDYILNVTEQEDLFYIGFSMGSTDFLAMVDTAPEYYDKIRLSVLLAPVSYSGRMPHPLFQFLAHSSLDYIESFAISIGWYEILPETEMSAKVLPFCSDKSPIQIVCSTLISLLTGWDFVQFNASTMPLIFSVAPGTGSLKAILHYGQLIVSGKFRKYDYGLLGNIAKYGQSFPPDYDLSKITSPVALYYGPNDQFISVTDVNQLASELPNVVRQYLVPDENFNHIDFLYAKQIDELVYDDVIQLLVKYSK